MLLLLCSPKCSPKRSRRRSPKCSPRRSGQRFVPRSASPWALLALVGAAGLAGCRSGAGDGADAGLSSASARPKGPVLEAAENETASSAPRAVATALAAGEKVAIPASRLVSGSTPGDRGRDPMLEPALVEVDLGAFEIDRWLYPNDPAKRPLTGVTREKAEELCSARGARLCTELEWELACKGPEGHAFAGGESWAPACAKEPRSCASGFGVLGLGAALREWTSSDVGAIEKGAGVGEAPGLARGASVRGARADAVAAEHRCARRAAVDPTATADDLGFRCCHGAKNAATIASPAWKETFKKAELSRGELAAMLAAVPNLAEIASDPTFFKEPDDANVVLARGDAGAAPPNVTLTTAPIAWSPVPGEQLLVVTGRSGKSSFVLAFYALPGGRHRLGSSLVLRDERGPIALGTNPYNRRRIQWGTCWECKGESGTIGYREDNRVVITQH